MGGYTYGSGARLGRGSFICTGHSFGIGGFGSGQRSGGVTFGSGN
jgi:hypothetical protein